MQDDEAEEGAEINDAGLSQKYSVDPGYQAMQPRWAGSSGILVGAAGSATAGAAAGRIRNKQL